MTKSGKHCGKRRNFTFCAISSLVTVFKKPSAAEVSESVYIRERVKCFLLLLMHQNTSACEKEFIVLICFNNLVILIKNNIMVTEEAVEKYGEDKIKTYSSSFVPMYYALTENKVKCHMKLVCLLPNEKVGLIWILQIYSYSS